MGRKKKNQNEEETQEEKDWQWDVRGDVKKSLVAIFLSALGIIITLGFFEKSGIVGGKIGGAIALTIGWMKWLFPLFLFGASVILLIKEKTSFYIWKIVGLFIVLFSSVSFLHWFYPLSEMGKLAGEGKGGGYLGFAGAYLSVRFLGEAGGLVIILCSLLAGTIFTFNFSLAVSPPIFCQYSSSLSPTIP